MLFPTKNYLPAAHLQWIEARMHSAMRIRHILLTRRAAADLIIFSLGIYREARSFPLGQHTHKPFIAWNIIFCVCSCENKVWVSRLWLRCAERFVVDARSHTHWCCWEVIVLGLCVGRGILMCAVVNEALKLCFPVTFKWPMNSAIEFADAKYFRLLNSGLF
jgi:hypothetical protein